MLTGLTSSLYASISSAWRDRTAATWLIVFLAIDSVLLVLHLGHTASKHYGLLTPFDAEVFSLEHEGGFAEFFEYGKALLAAVIFLVIYRKNRAVIFILLSAVYVLHVMDNSLRLHEQAGAAMQPKLVVATGLSADYSQALGEILTFGSAGFLIAIAAGTAMWRMAPTLRHAALAAILLLGIIAIFGIGVDAVHAAINHWYHVEKLTVLVEDGGELAVLSLATAHAIALASSGRDHIRTVANPPASLA